MTETWEPTYEANSGDRTLDGLMALAFAAGSAVARTEELRVPALICRTEDDAIQSYHLVQIDGIHAADAVHVILHGARATHAAVCFESWQYEVPATPEMLADHAAGRPVRAPDGAPRPSEHPDRFDVLMLIGEIKGAPQVVRSWRLEARPDGSRALIDHRSQDGAANPVSRFNPLFRSAEEVRLLVRREAELQRMRDAARNRTN